MLPFTPRHLKDNVTALDFSLSPEQIKTIDQALPFDFGQPMAEASTLAFIWSVASNVPQFGLDPHVIGYQQHASMVSAGLVDYVPYRQALDNSKLRESDAAAAAQQKSA